MSAELAAEVVERELGRRPDEVFVEWDPEPIAAASIGQVHRAVASTRRPGEERAVAVKVQYPGVADAIEADLANTELLGIAARARASAGSTRPRWSPRSRSGSPRSSTTAARPPTSAVRRLLPRPPVHPRARPCCRSCRPARVLTSELVVGAPWREVLTWDQHQRDLAGEGLFRFVFRSLYRMRAFNGDPHPGNYLFHGDGRITFLDFGLVRYFSDAEIDDVRGDGQGRRPSTTTPPSSAASSRTPGCCDPDAPVRDRGGRRLLLAVLRAGGRGRAMTWTQEYASAIVRHTFDRTSPIAQYATVPRAFVFIQRINLGLYALLGDLGPTGNYRRMAEELWPFADGPPSTPMGEAEAEWLARIPRVSAHVTAFRSRPRSRTRAEWVSSPTAT